MRKKERQVGNGNEKVTHMDTAWIYLSLRSCALCGFSLLMAAVFSASAADGGRGEQKAWKIMPVGDSITEGGKFFSNWRYPLLQKLIAAGYPVEYVGSRKSESPVGPLPHEGYSGKDAEFLATVIGKNFKKNPADIVLIHAGHNHFAEEKPVPGIIAATEKIISDLRAVNPKVIVLLAQVIPSGKLPKYSYIPELNKELVVLAKSLNKQDQPVIIVD
jgi:hypothetical protein